MIYTHTGTAFAGAPEIEVTPEMIEAGMNVLWRYPEPSEDELSEAVKLAFVAMLQVHLVRSKKA